jgi:hypothetical protein
MAKVLICARNIQFDPGKVPGHHTPRLRAGDRTTPTGVGKIHFYLEAKRYSTGENASLLFAQTDRILIAN